MRSLATPPSEMPTGLLEESFALDKRPAQGDVSVLAAWKLEKSRHKTFRLCGHYLLAIATLTHVDGAIHNLRNFSGPMK
jgi:hypothetical protein